MSHTKIVKYATRDILTRTPGCDAFARVLDPDLRFPITFHLWHDSGRGDPFVRALVRLGRRDEHGDAVAGDEVCIEFTPAEFDALPEAEVQI
jgi:hypothetical protein